MKIYVATSWRNDAQPEVVKYLRDAGHEVYDFRNPREHDLQRDNGFHWNDIDEQWQAWTPEQFRAALNHPLSLAGFASDMAALVWCDAVLLVMPCGRSSHLELGWGIGAGKRTAILLAEGEPELMYAMVDDLLISWADVDRWLAA